MNISEGQIKGLIALCLTLAIIPFFSFIYHLLISYKAPALTDQFSDSLAIEIVEKNQTRGIYFISRRPRILDKRLPPQKRDANNNRH
jgi:hypothetical protein